MKRLCFGTFASVLRSCIPKKNTRLVTPQKRFVGIVLKSVNAAYDISTEDYTTSRLLSCNNSLSDDVTIYAQHADVKAVSHYFAKNILPLLDPNKTKLVILALRDIIKSDNYIDGETIIDLVKGISKNALREQDEFELVDFLAGVFLYSVIFVDNTVGKECVKDIDDEYFLSFEGEKDKIKLINQLATKSQSKTNTVNEVNTYLTDPQIFKAYLEKVKDKYSKIKTLLYSDQPKPFYDFYVCNNIDRRITVTGEYGTPYKRSTIKNVTVKVLAESSHFVMLTGTGGLGKSMMMRHLLLNAVESYDDLGIIPIFIPLKDFDETVPNLLKYVFLKVKSICGEIGNTQTENALNFGKCLLLLDGLDELGSNITKRFERELEEFSDKYPNNYFVISSRPYQSFISYSRFAVFQVKPFTKKQALELIDKLEFRPDDPIIKMKFRNELENNLFKSHSTFIENPLLLTIMLLTFEQYAEVPSKMHIFYREAFSALAIKHDASKGAYKRTLKTGLSSDKFADYFAELCARSYCDEKFELSKNEFVRYYESLNERKKTDDSTTSANDFLYDLCSNLCMMYYESGKYFFTHRSFQEYFCALYFSKQKDKNLNSIGKFFENRRVRMYADKTFNMLYDMIPEKVEEYIFLPFLEELFDQIDKEEGYWTFLKILYPTLIYEEGETLEFIINDPQSYLYDFIKNINGLMGIDCDNFPHYDSLVRTEYVYVVDDNGNEVLVDSDEVTSEYEYDNGTPEIVGRVYEFEIEDIRKSPRQYRELLDLIDNDDCDLRHEYFEIRKYHKALQKNSRPVGNSMFDFF